MRSVRVWCWNWIVWSLLWIMGRGLGASPVTALSFSPDGQTLAAAGRRVITLHHVDRPNEVTTLETDLPKITALAFHPNGKLLAVAGGTPGANGAALLLRLDDGGEFSRVTSATDVAAALAFDGGGQQLAVAGGAMVRMYELSPAGLIPKHELSGHVGAVLGVAFSPDGSLLVTVGRDRSVKVWSTAQGTLLRSFSQPTDIVHAVAFRPLSPTWSGPAMCATAGDEKAVRVWQPGIGRMVRIVRGHEGSILALAYAPEGGALFTAGSEGTIRRVDADSDEIQKSWKAGGDWIYALTASPVGGLVAAGDWQGDVTLWTHDGLLRAHFVPIAATKPPP